ncbi:hypothetical protein [Marinobacterium zhoushanense]|uniref:hypothetical protein n=1 Tax=Marinobacterium zhoushanense TaxID=1679163 RepID=UPI0016689623|nr:hypothetical protein [Marinobacterium zhoushanense]
MSVSISLILLLSSAWFDAKGFHYATQAWHPGGQVAWKQGVLSLLFFVVGVSIYLLSVRFLTLAGVSSSTVQTLLWFMATILGVALLSGEIQRWSALQYAALAATIVGLAVLMATGEH